MLEVTVVVLASYLLGAVPVGMVVGQARGIDIRAYGSGKIGAANTLRTLGIAACALVFIGDLAKGALPVLLARFVLGTQAAEVAAALAAVAGHNWSVYIGFQGGRGVNTAIGGMAAMSWPVAVTCVGVGLVTIAITRYVSLGSMLGALTLLLVMPPLVLMGREPVAYLVYSLAATSLILLQHRDNISRLQAGTERKLGQREVIEG